MRLIKQRGFTILEIIAMVVVIAAVLVITVPKFQMMVRQSSEGRTKASLGEIRGAVAIYYSDNSFLYPSDDGTPETRLSQSIVPKYLKRLPDVDLPRLHPKKLNTVEDRINDQGNWLYTTLDGFVGVNCTHADTKGGAVSNW